MKKLKNNFFSVFCVMMLLALPGCDTDKAADQSPAAVNSVAVGQMDKPPQVAVKANTQPQQTENSGASGEPLPTISSASEPDDGYREIQWDDLVPAEYRPETILAKYMEELSALDDSDPKAMQLYGQIQAELDNAPINEALNGKKIKLAGFIAPLENTDGKVTDFLLVPFFGACIHVPPPPVNQTVLVNTAQDSAIDSEEAASPYWIKGTLLTGSQTTDIGAAGYHIENAVTEVFE